MNPATKKISGKYCQSNEEKKVKNEEASFFSLDLSILDVSKIVMYEYWFGNSNQSMEMQNYPTWINTAL